MQQYPTKRMRKVFFIRLKFSQFSYFIIYFLKMSWTSTQSYIQTCFKNAWLSEQFISTTNHILLVLSSAVILIPTEVFKNCTGYSDCLKNSIFSGSDQQVFTFSKTGLCSFLTKSMINREPSFEYPKAVFAQRIRRKWCIFPVMAIFGDT